MRLEVKELSFSYGEHSVLQKICFHGVSGERMALLGCNGAGKTTLFKCLLRLLKPEHGTVLLDDKELCDLSRTELARKVAYIPQSSVPTFNYTALDTVLMGITGSMRLLETPGQTEKQTAMMALEQLGIAQLCQRGICELSGGERQLVHIARAMVQKAQILVMDEPTANLDYGNQLRIMQQLAELTKRGYFILFSTHNPEHALLYADKALVLHQKKVFAFGDAKQVLTEDCLREIYGIDVAVRELDIDGKAYRLCVPMRGV